jgi:predicted metal-dependent peptidase
LSKEETECLRVLAEVRALIRQKAPYYSRILYGLRPYFEKDLGTLGVTKGMVLIIDPVWFVKMDEALVDLDPGEDEKKARLHMQAGCIVHECNHIFRNLDRIERMPDKDLANKAFDIPINDDLKEGGWTLPHWAIYSDSYDFEPGLSGEAYYELLKKGAKKKKGKGGGGGKGKKGKGGKGNKKGKGGGSSGEGKFAAGKCGTCAGGAIDKKLEEEVDAKYGKSKATRQRIRKNALNDIQRELRKGGKGRGTIPASFKELIEIEEKPPMVPWRVRLARVCRRATGRVVSGRSDFSLRRPSKRSYCRGIIRPGMIDRKPIIAFVEDSSGSMGPSQLKQARIEAAGVMKQTGVENAWFMDADAAVAAPPRIIRLRDIAQLPVHGGGGTNFIPALKRVEELNPKPDVVIYLTDGDGPAPKNPPKGFEVVWCIVPTGYGRKPANWGHLIVCSDDQELREPYEI